MVNVKLAWNRTGKKEKLGASLSLIIGIIAFILGLLQGGFWGFLTIPLFLIGLFGVTLGTVPFIGPVLYYLGIGWIFNSIRSLAGNPIPIASDLLFWSNFVFSCIYCFVSSLSLIILLLTRRQLKKAKDLLKTIGKKDGDKI